MKLKRQCQANERPQTRSLYWCLSVFCILFLLVELSFGSSQSGQACQPVLSLHDPKGPSFKESQLVSRAQLQTLTVESNSSWRESIFSFVIARSLHLPQSGLASQLSLIVFESQTEADRMAQFFVGKDVFNETRVYQLTAGEGVHRLPRFEELESLLDTKQDKPVPFIVVMSTQQLKDYLVQQAKALHEPIAFIMNLLMERVHSLVTVEQRRLDENPERKSEQLGTMIRRYLRPTSALAHIIVEEPTEKDAVLSRPSTESLTNKTSVPASQKTFPQTQPQLKASPQWPPIKGVQSGLYDSGYQQPSNISHHLEFLRPKIKEVNTTADSLPTEKIQAEPVVKPTQPGKDLGDEVGLKKDDVNRGLRLDGEQLSLGMGLPKNFKPRELSGGKFPQLNDFRMTFWSENLGAHERMMLEAPDGEFSQMLSSKKPIGKFLSNMKTRNTGQTYADGGKAAWFHYFGLRVLLRLHKLGKIGDSDELRARIQLLTLLDQNAHKAVSVEIPSPTPFLDTAILMNSFHKKVNRLLAETPLQRIDKVLDSVEFKKWFSFMTHFYPGLDGKAGWWEYLSPLSFSRLRLSGKVEMSQAALARFEKIVQDNRLALTAPAMSPRNTPSTGEAGIRLATRVDARTKANSNFRLAPANNDPSASQIAARPSEVKGPIRRPPPPVVTDASMSQLMDQVASKLVELDDRLNMESSKLMALKKFHGQSSFDFEKWNEILQNEKTFEIETSENYEYLTEKQEIIHLLSKVAMRGSNSVRRIAELDLWRDRFAHSDFSEIVKLKRPELLRGDFVYETTSLRQRDGRISKLRFRFAQALIEELFYDEDPSARKASQLALDAIQTGFVEDSNQGSARLEYFRPRTHKDSAYIVKVKFSHKQVGQYRVFGTVEEHVPEKFRKDGQNPLVYINFVTWAAEKGHDIEYQEKIFLKTHGKGRSTKWNSEFFPRN